MDYKLNLRTIARRNWTAVNLRISITWRVEGVNTKAKNVIIFDNTIAREKLDFFTFNNIKGRSGRMFEHFVGRVFLFHEPPDVKALRVDSLDLDQFEQELVKDCQIAL